MVGSLKIFCV